MRCDQNNLAHTCGVRLYHFMGYYGNVSISKVSLGGAELGCAGFVNTSTCEKAYNELKEKFNIVYQSTPRLNRNSNRQFFFVVYDGKRRNRK